MDPANDCRFQSGLPWINSHLATAPPIFKIFWTVSSICSFLVVAITFPLIRRHLSTGEELRKEQGLALIPSHSRLTIQILFLLPLLAVTSWLSLFILRQSLLLELLAYLYNMACLFWFFELLIVLMGGNQAAMSLLKDQPPWRIYAVPPLCCWNVFARRRTFAEADFRIVRMLIFQYAVMGPLIALADALNESYLSILHYMRIAVTILCIWGLLTVYRASQHILKDFNTGQKYAVVQVTVLLMNFASLITKNTVPAYDDVYTAEVMAESWVHVIFSAVMLPLAILAVKAYPTSDLRRLQRRTHLERQAQPDLEKASAIPLYKSSSTASDAVLEMSAPMRSPINRGKPQALRESARDDIAQQSTTDTGRSSDMGSWNIEVETSCLSPQGMHTPLASAASPVISSSIASAAAAVARTDTQGYSRDVFVTPSSGNESSCYVY